jgi:hypothetical protein
MSPHLRSTQALARRREHAAPAPNLDAREEQARRARRAADRLPAARRLDVEIVEIGGRLMTSTNGEWRAVAAVMEGSAGRRMEMGNDGRGAAGDY